MALTFDATYYLQQRPDVFQAFVAAAGSTGLTWAQFAEQHYNNNGRFEGSNPNAIFNTNEYLTANPDVAAAGVNPFQHYLANGVNEGRAPSDSFPSFASFDEATYLAANPDLGAAGITTKNQAYAHFVLNGQFEGRPGAPEVGTTNPGEVKALTNAVEVVQGTTGDDTFTAVVNDAQPLLSTLNSGDAVIGSAGKDTLRVTVSDGGAEIIADLNSVETIEVRAFDNQAFNLSTSKGVEAVSLTGTSDVKFTAVKNIVAATVTDTTTADLTLTYDAAVVAGTADAQKVTVSNATTTVSAAGIETFDVVSSGTANALTLTSAQAKTVNVSGSAAISVAGVDATVTTFDASASKGGVSTSFTANDVKATGGSGDDTFVFGNSLTKADVVNGGEGFDTVSVIGGDYTAAAAAAAFNALTSIERLAFTGAAETTINGSTLTNTTITNFLFDTTDAAKVDTVKNASSTAIYEIGTSNVGDLALELKAGGSTANITLNGLDNVTPGKNATTADVGAVSVVLAGGDAKTAVTVNLTSEGSNFDTGFANEVGVITVNAGSTVNVTGTGDLVIAGLGNKGTIDATSFTGKLSVAGKSAGDATSVDTIKLGSGQSVVNFDATSSGNLDGAAVVVDTIEGFKTGATGDVLDFAGVAATFTAISSAVQANIDALSGVGATLAAAADLAANFAGGATNWTAFSFQGETYALYDAADVGAFDAAADVLVKLAGVSAGDLVAANFA